MAVPTFPHTRTVNYRDGWIYEEKYDGWRMVAYKDGTHVQLVSRPHRSWLPGPRHLGRSA